MPKVCKNLDFRFIEIFDFEYGIRPSLIICAYFQTLSYISMQICCSLHAKLITDGIIYFLLKMHDCVYHL